jgi:hypothetical protein
MQYLLLIGGYYLVEAETPEAAVSMSAKIPGARYGCIEDPQVLLGGRR